MPAVAPAPRLAIAPLGVAKLFLAGQDHEWSLVVGLTDDPIALLVLCKNIPSGDWVPIKHLYLKMEALLRENTKKLLNLAGT